MDKNIDIDTIKYNAKTYIFLCPICGKTLPFFKKQYAHFLSQGKYSVKQYGKEIINHPGNGVYVCSLECNNKIQIDKNPGEIKKHLNNLNWRNE
ncbi:MAG: hypothetical protein OEV44_01295 [Spirochaetota bacterium]|nr:hypothetical protein [Spirochaetota bacterium]